MQDGPQLETAQVSINWWMHKQIVTYLYNKIPFINEREQNIDTITRWMNLEARRMKEARYKRENNVFL